MATMEQQRGTVRDDLGEGHGGAGAPGRDGAAAGAVPAVEGPTGRLAFGLGLAGLVLVPTLVLGVIVGLAAVVLGVRARRSLRVTSRPAGLATLAIVVGAVAVVVPVVAAALLVRSSGS